jgi:hypothetical protein
MCEKIPLRVGDLGDWWDMLCLFTLQKWPLYPADFLDGTISSLLHKFFFGMQIIILDGYQGCHTDIFRGCTHNEKRICCGMCQDGPAYIYAAVAEVGHILCHRELDLTFTVERLVNLVSLTNVAYHCLGWRNTAYGISEQRVKFHPRWTKHTSTTLPCNFTLCSRFST